jgi:hypothetical protein
VLDRQSRVADELGDAPVDARAVEDGCRGAGDRTQLRLPDGEVDVDRRGVHVAVGVLVGDEARDVDVRDDQRRREQLQRAASFRTRVG